MSFYSIDGNFSNDGLIENFDMSSFNGRSKGLEGNELNKKGYSNFKSNEFIPVENISRSYKPYAEKDEKKKSHCLTMDKQLVCYADSNFKSVKTDLNKIQEEENIRKNRLKQQYLREQNVVKDKNKKNKSHLNYEFEKDFGKYLVVKKPSPKAYSTKNILSKLSSKKKTSVKSSTSSKKSSPGKIKRKASKKTSSKKIKKDKKVKNN